MKRILFSTAVVLVTIGSVSPSLSAPVSCDPGQERDSSGRLVSSITANSHRITQELRSRGINATRVEDWNGCIRAYVAGADGSSRMQYFEPNTYRRLQ